MSDDDDCCIETVPQPSFIQSEKLTDMFDRVQPRKRFIVSQHLYIRVTCTTNFV